MNTSDDSKDMILYEGRMRRETEKAVLFRFSFPDNNDGIEHWIPFSQIGILKINKNGIGKDTLKIPKWIARAKKIPIPGEDSDDTV